MHKKEIYYIPGSILISGFVIALSIYTSANILIKGNPGVKATATTTRPATDTSNTKIPPVTRTDHIRGDISAKVVIVEYSDTECPFCKRFHKTLEQITKTFTARDVAWVYRHYPIDNLHSKARKEAEATECAAEQGGNATFWQYTDKLYEITPSNKKLEESELVTSAKTVGLDTKAFETCLASGKYAAKVEADRVGGANAGARGTPFSFLVTPKTTTSVNGSIPFENLKSQIEAAF